MVRASLHALFGLAAAAFMLTAAPAVAQSSICQEGAKLLSERQSLVQQLNKSAGKDKKLDPRMACGAFGKLNTNGESILKWMETNKDWCQIPDQAVQTMRDDQGKIKDLRGQACNAAAKLAQMEKQARQQQQQQSGNPFGGGLTGQYTMPKGAL